MICSNSRFTGDECVAVLTLDLRKPDTCCKCNNISCYSLLMPSCPSSVTAHSVNSLKGTFRLPT